MNKTPFLCIFFCLHNPFPCYGIATPAPCGQLINYQNTAERTVYEVIGASWAAGGGFIQNTSAIPLMRACRQFKIKPEPAQNCTTKNLESFLQCLLDGLDKEGIKTSGENKPGNNTSTNSIIQYHLRLLSFLNTKSTPQCFAATQAISLRRAAAELACTGNSTVHGFFLTAATALCDKTSPKHTTWNCGNWVSGHVSTIRHDKLELPSTLPEAEQYFVYQTAVCAGKVLILKNLLAACAIRSEEFNLYDSFWGHTALWVYYDGKPHHVDPAYGGYFVNQSGEILSWEEIMSDPHGIQTRVEHFPDTQDTESLRPGGPRLDNKIRMGQFYSPQRLAKTKLYGRALPSERYVNLPATVDLRQRKDFFLGKPDGDRTDVAREGFSKCSSYYLDMLGNYAFNMNHAFLITAEPGVKWKLTLIFSDDAGQAKTFYAKSRKIYKLSAAKNSAPTPARAGK